MLLHDVIMTQYCCQRYAECLVTTLCSNRTVHRTPRCARATAELLRQDEAVDQWRGGHKECVRAIGEHFEYSLWTDNVDFVHICYIQSDLFDCYIFNYAMIPATLA